MEFVETFHGGRLVPFYALCLFAGIRPDWQDGEISKIEERLFDLPRRRLSLPPEKTKTRRKRDVVLQPNLVAWLTKYPLSNYPIICTNFKKLRIKVQRRFRPGHDVLRHSYCSYLVGKFRSVGDTALQAGNSERVIWSNYLDLVSEEDADAFWKIRPIATAPTNVSTDSNPLSLTATSTSN
jgi:integrase